jgi:hypothetical protein
VFNEYFADGLFFGIGCPHNTYHEMVKWGRLVTEALEMAGKEKAAIPVYLFCPNVVRARLVEEEELASRMKRAGMHSSNMCGVSYAGMKGFSEYSISTTRTTSSTRDQTEDQLEDRHPHRHRHRHSIEYWAIFGGRTRPAQIQPGHCRRQGRAAQQVAQVGCGEPSDKQYISEEF